MLVLALQVALFAHLIWLGFFLVSRSERPERVRMVAVSLLLLAANLGLGLIAQTPTPTSYEFRDVVLSVLAAPVVMGVGLFGILRSGAIAQQSMRNNRSTFAVLGLASALIVAGWILLILEGSGVPWVVLLLVGIGLLAAGVHVARIRSIESGEALLPDLVRSYDYSFLIAAVFSGQVVLAMWTGPGATEQMVALLLGTITAAIAIQVFLDRVQTLLDRIAFANVPWLRQERANLREIENLLPRVNMTDPLTIPEEEFSKLTRRALSNYGDLTKLATNPLTNLPEVHRRLLARGVEPSTLERARELKVLLAEAIERLKPMTGDELGTTDEWRFYNALYYPYIVGMRPYSTTAVHSFDEAGYYDVLDWFRTYVPERTLYNWQNSAAALIAGYLRELEESAVSPETTPSPELTTVS